MPSVRNAIKCPACGESETLVFDSRGRPELSAIVRCRRCEKCLIAFDTIETVRMDANLRHIRSSGEAIRNPARSG